MKTIDVKKRLQEHLEELLNPDATSLNLTMRYLPTPVGKKKPKRKEAVMDILHRYTDSSDSRFLTQRCL